MPNVSFNFNQGINTASPKEELVQGELISGVGIWYKPGDKHNAHRIPGRTEFGDTGTAEKVVGVLLTQYDTGGTDRVLAYSSGIIYSATPGATGSFSTLVSGLSYTASVFNGVHYNDRWYLYNGVDANRVVSPDGSVVLHGMVSPQTAPTVSGNDPGTLQRPTGDNAPSDWVNTEYAYDADEDTFASVTRNTNGASNALFISGFADDATGTDRKLFVTYRLAGFQMTPDGGEAGGSQGGGYYGRGGGVTADYDVNIQFSYSVNGGSSYTTVLNERRITAHGSDQVGQVNIADGVNLSDVILQAKLVYNVGAATATFRISDVRAGVGGDGVTTTDNGLYYCVTEYDQDRGWESPPSSESSLTTLSGVGANSITLPTTIQNTNTTHLKVYRTPDGGTIPDDFGLIGMVPSGTTVFVDDFQTWPITEQPRPPLGFIQIDQRTGDPLRIPRDTPAPPVRHLNVFKSSLVGPSASDPRQLRYSVPGLPQSWPEIYVIAGLPFLERDELVGTMTVGDSLILLAKDNIASTTKLPVIVNGIFDASDIVPMRGQPGTVGERAFTAYSVAGEPRGAWVSRYGVHMTDGINADRLTDDLDWENTIDTTTLSTCELFWFEKYHILLFSYDSSGNGVNDRFLAFHMHPEHRKASTRPKVTGPHYGAIRAISAGFVSNTFRMYSAHASNGKVYLDWTGTQDYSNAYDGSGNIPTILHTGRLYGDWDFLEVYKANLRSTDFGTGKTATVAWTTGRDNSESTQAVSKTVSLQGRRGDEFYVGRAGEWHEAKLTFINKADGQFKDIRMDVKVQGDAGELA